jgi:hypothetical protein
MEPPVSDPNEYIASPAATAAAEPPLEPPGTLSTFHGFLVCLKYELSVVLPMANSSILSFPSKIAPLSYNFFITVAS